MKTPKYLEIEKWLRMQVQHLKPGDFMPTIAEACERFNVGGVQTVRNAYAPLIAEGLVVRVSKPRRWAVADRGQEPFPLPDTGPMLADLEARLTGALDVVRELRARPAAA